MRRAIFVLILIFANFSIVWAASFEDQENGYKLEYPSGWSANKISEAIVKANILKDQVTGVQVRIYDSNNMPLDSYSKWFADDFMRQMQSRWGGTIKVIEQGPASLTTSEGIVISYDFTRGDGKTRFLKTYLFGRGGSKVYVLQCGTTKDERSINEPIINSIANSFNFTH